MFSHVQAFPSGDQSCFTVLRFCRAKFVNSTQLYSERPSRLPWNQNRTPPKKNHSISQGALFLQHGAASVLAYGNTPLRLSYLFCLLALILSSLDYLTTSSPAFLAPLLAGLRTCLPISSLSFTCVMDMTGMLMHLLRAKRVTE
jgi:hypothetical protein